MSELDGTRLKTADKKLAMVLLERCLGSVQPINAEVSHINSIYSVDVTDPID